MERTLHPIGVIHTPFASKEETPIQGCLPAGNRGKRGAVSGIRSGLKDIETFSHLILIYHFDRAGEVILIRPTFLDDQPHGVVCLASPLPTNGLGMSVVSLLRREGDVLRVGGVDVLDGTPLIDIKPYLPRYDCFPEAKWRLDRR